MYGKPSTPVNCQAKFESFLDAQERKQRAAWFSCLPSILDELARAINLAKDALISDEEKATNHPMFGDGQDAILLKYIMEISYLPIY